VKRRGKGTDDETDYSQLFEELAERLSEPDDSERIRRIARDETDRRVLGWLSVAAFFAAVAYWGWWGLVVAVVLLLIWGYLDHWKAKRQPGGERHLIADQAEDLVRLQIVAEAHQAGERVWSVEPEEYKSAGKKIVAVESARWEVAWRRMYAAALDFRDLSPLQRKRKLKRASEKAREALNQGEAMAKAEDAKLTSWAASALYDLERPH
jgi:hypothetical protein